MPIPRRLQRMQQPSVQQPSVQQPPSPQPSAPQSSVQQPSATPQSVSLPVPPEVSAQLPASSSDPAPAGNSAAFSQLAALSQLAGLGGLPPRPQNLSDLKDLLATYGPLMNAESRALVTETLTQLEAGADAASLQSLAQRLQQALPGGGS